MTDKQNVIELVSSALVREYLATKRILLTLKHMDIEYPRGEQAISSRRELAQCLGLHRPCKGSAILEVLVRRLLLGKSTPIICSLEKADEKALTNEISHEEKETAEYTSTVAVPCNHNETTCRREGESDRKVEHDDDIDEREDTHDDISLTASINPLETQKEITADEPCSNSSLVVEEISHAVIEENRQINIFKSDNQHTPLFTKIDTVAARKELNNCMINTGETSINSTINNVTKNIDSLIQSNNEEVLNNTAAAAHEIKDTNIKSILTRKFVASKCINFINKNSMSSPSSETKTDNACKFTEQAVSDVVVPQRVEPPPDGSTPLALPAAMQLKTLILGDSEGYFPNTWKEEGIVFTTNLKLGYGLELYKEGPCGALAALQGFVLKSLIFCGAGGSRPARDDENVLEPSPERARAALVAAVSDVLWLCGQRRRACLAIPTSEGALLSGQGRYRRDGITEGLLLLQFEGSVAEVRTAVERHLHVLQAPGGCALFLCSAVLSRGLVEVAEDMGDACTSLLARGGECAPELVSLVLTGRATMRQEKGDSRLGGVSARADIGLLALAEHYGHCQVGSFLKTPRYPIWLVLAHGRYSVLFSTRRQLVSDWRAELAFRLHLYVGASQTRPMQLAVSTANCTQDEEEDHANSPVELAIRTKWTGASIQWISVPDQQE